MGRFIGILIAVAVLATAAITLLSFLNTPPEDEPTRTATATHHAAPPQPATPDANPVHRSVTMYRHGVRPSLVRVGDFLFGWIGNFYQTNQAHFVDLAWTIFATVFAGLILQRMTRATA